MQTIARRIKAARDVAGLTQQELADALGIKDRQTVAAIEAGIRKVTADELLQLMKVLGKDLEYFTDPFRLDGEGTFSWRSNPDVEDRLGDFEARAGSWLAVYRELVRTGDDTRAPRTSPLRLNLTPKSSYEDAHHAAEWLAAEWKLGDVPALRLADAIRERLRALVLHVDAPYGISGAAFRLPEFSAILINRKENLGRRNFDLAHELFHLLTWDTMQPAHTEAGMLNAKGRPEQLANCFASALLMPERAIRAWLDALPTFPPKDRAHWRRALNDRAFELRVSTPAFQWRLVQLGLLPRSDVDTAIDWVGEREAPEDAPRLFSREFVIVLGRGIDAGTLSVRKAGTLLGLTIDELADLFRGYEVEVPFDI